jgi:hypothetical protein
MRGIGAARDQRIKVYSSADIYQSNATEGKQPPLCYADRCHVLFKNQNGGPYQTP